MFSIMILVITWCVVGIVCALYQSVDEPWKHWTIKQKAVILILYGPIVWLAMLLAVILLCVKGLYDTYADKWVTKFWNWLGDKK